MKYSYRKVEGSQSQISFGRSLNFLDSFFEAIYNIQEFLGEVKKTATVTSEQEKDIYDFILEAAMFNLYPRLKREGKELEEALSKEIAGRFGEGALYVEHILRMAYRYRDQLMNG